MQPGGGFVAANVPLRHVIRVAFQLQDNQIVGGPDWIDTDRFDIEAKGTTASAVPGVELLHQAAKAVRQHQQRDRLLDDARNVAGSIHTGTGPVCGPDGDRPPGAADSELKGRPAAFAKGSGGQERVGPYFDVRVSEA